MQLIIRKITSFLEWKFYLKNNVSIEGAFVLCFFAPFLGSLSHVIKKQLCEAESLTGRKTCFIFPELKQVGTRSWNQISINEQKLLNQIKVEIQKMIFANCSGKWIF